MTTYSYQLSEVNGVLVSNPESQVIDQHDAMLSFELVGEAATNFRLTGYTANDTKNQLGAASFNKTETVMTIPDANTKAATINITVLSAHRTTGTVYHTDPSAVNRPPS